MNLNSFKAIAIGTLIGSASIASALSSDIDWKPYLGAEYQYDSLKGKADWRDSLPKSYHSGRVYFGTKFHENAGLEFGYATSSGKSKDRSLDGASTAFGGIPTAGTTNMKVKLSGFDVYLNGYLPVMENVNAIGSIGMGWTRPKVTGRSTGAGVFHTAMAAIKGSRKMVPMIGLGGEYMYNNVGLRAKLTWKNTSRMRVKNVAAAGFNIPEKAFKNSIGFSLGAHYHFM